MKRQIISAVLLALISLSCSGGGSTDSQAVDIWPLAVGNEWRGTITCLDEIGGVTGRVPMFTSISGDTTIDNRTWYYVSTFSNESERPGVASLIVSNQNDGLHRAFLPLVFREPGHVLDESLWIKYPAANGDTYSTDDQSVAVLSTEERLESLGGSHTCLSYIYDCNTGYQRYYLCPGIGMIKYEIMTPCNSNGSSSSVETARYYWELENVIHE